MAKSKEPPHALDTETAIISHLLAGKPPSAWPTLRDLCPQIGAFFGRNNRAVVIAMNEVAAAGGRVEYQTIKDMLGRIGLSQMMDAVKRCEREACPSVAFGAPPDAKDSALEWIGGDSVLMAYMDTYAPPSGHAQNCTIIHRLWKLRKAVSVVSELDTILSRVSARDEMDLEIDTAIASLSALKSDNKRTASTMSKAGELSLDQHDNRTPEKPPVQCARWGIPILDRNFPLRRNTVMILAAEPGCGKTSLALHALMQTAADFHESAAMATLEMPAVDLANIVIGRELGVPGTVVEQGRLMTSQREKATAILARWRGEDALLRDECHGATTCDAICSWARERHLVGGGRLALLVIDHLQEIARKDDRQSEYESINYSMTSLRQLAMSLGICVLLLSQYRKDDGKHRGPPRRKGNADLHGSGNIEKVAAGILHLHRPDRGSKVTNCFVDKHRYGVPSEFNLMFHAAEGQRFEEEPPQFKNEPQQTIGLSTAQKAYSDPTTEEDRFKEANDGTM